MPKRADIRVRLNSIKRKAKNTTYCTAKRTDKAPCVVHTTHALFNKHCKNKWLKV